jgi:AcrR family transcriptional regulator
MNLRDQQREQTRRIILDALARVIVESGTVGFSVEEVARAAGVTHRTVYNYFPTREALNDAFAVYVEEQLATVRPQPDETFTLESLVSIVDGLYDGLQARETYVRAYVMLMIASRAPAKVARDRTATIEALIASEADVQPPLTASQVAAAIRMFLSSTGWHLLTEHMGLSPEAAAATATWATQALLDAATKK